jgi:murein DD-endopeptidase MepM/ murein hydrolase activator NlpD
MARKYYTIQIFSSDGATALTKRVSKGLITFLLTIASIVALGLIALVVFYGRVYVKAMKVRNLEERNKFLESEFEKISSLEEDILEIGKQREKLEVILGIKARREIPEDALIKRPVVISEGNGDDSTMSDVSFETPEMEAYIAESKLKNRVIPNLIPVNGWITKQFDPIHKGVDIAAPSGTPIIATMDGVVEDTRWDSVFGNVVEIGDPSGYKTFYGHCAAIYVKKGDIIRRGDIIAGVGQTGNALAPHLHYEIAKDDQKLNPEFFFLKGVTK